MIREGGTQANASFFCFLLLKTESLIIILMNPFHKFFLEMTERL